MKKLPCVLTAVMFVGLSAGLRSQQPQEPPPVRAMPTDASTAEDLFLARCAGCHGTGTTPGPNESAGARPAPVLADLRARSAEVVYRALDDGGVMAVHARGLSSSDRRRIGEWVSGKALAVVEILGPTQGQCAASPPPFGDWEKEPAWAGWSSDEGNGRFQPAGQAGLNASNIPKLKLKWAFAFRTATHADSQPTVCRRTRLRRERDRPGLLDRRHERLLLLGVPRRCHRTYRHRDWQGACGAAKPAIVFRRPQGERLRHRCTQRRTDLETED